MSYLPIQLSPEQQRIYDRMYAQAMQEGRPWTYDEHMGAIMQLQSEDFQNRYPDEWRRAQEVNPEDGILDAKLRRSKEMGQNQPKQPDSYYPPNWNNRPTKPQPDIYPPDIWNDFPTKPPDWGTDYPGPINDFPGPLTYQEPAPELTWVPNTDPLGNSGKMYSNLPQLQNNKFFSYLQNSMQKKRNNQY